MSIFHSLKNFFFKNSPEQEEEIQVSLREMFTKEFCNEFGRVLIVPQGRKLSLNLHKSVLQAVPQLYNSPPGKSLTVEEGGETFHIRYAGRGIYKVK